MPSRDRTDQARELRAAIRTRDAFLAIVARKLEAQVSALRSSARRGASASADVQAQLRALAGFARELRLIAEPERAIPMRRRKLELTKIIAHTLAAFGEHLPAPKRTLELTRAGSVVGRWDRDHVATMLLELLSNALKYGRTGPVTLRLEPRAASVRIVVSNQGGWVGQMRAIERFGRGRLHSQVEGFGVGLWLTQRIAAAHGGSFEIETGGAVTRAIITLPVEKMRGDVADFCVCLR
jgi:signal transduction histidine kinase